MGKPGPRPGPRPAPRAAGLAAAASLSASAPSRVHTSRHCVCRHCESGTARRSRIRPAGRCTREAPAASAAGSRLEQPAEPGRRPGADPEPEVVIIRGHVVRAGRGRAGRQPALSTHPGAASRCRTIRPVLNPGLWCALPGAAARAGQRSTSAPRCTPWTGTAKRAGRSQRCNFGVIPCSRGKFAARKELWQCVQQHACFF